MRKEREKSGRTSKGPWRISYQTSASQVYQVSVDSITTPLDSFTYLSDSTTWPDNLGWSTTWTEEVQ